MVVVELARAMPMLGIALASCLRRARAPLGAPGGAEQHQKELPGVALALPQRSVGPGAGPAREVTTDRPGQRPPAPDQL